jgi:hypothetical protein
VLASGKLPLSHLYDQEVTLLRVVRCLSAISRPADEDPALTALVRSASASAISTSVLAEALQLDELCERLETALDLLSGEAPKALAPPISRAASLLAPAPAHTSPLMAYVLPLMEVVFLTTSRVVASAAAAAPPALPPAVITRTQSISSMEPPPSPGGRLTPAPIALAPVPQPLPPGVAPRFVRFAEKHRRLLNDMVRQNPTLLEKGGSFASLISVPRLLDFDNKRRWFRKELEALNNPEENQYGDINLSVRRNRVFEDSYHQLQLRSPAELRGRISVQFAGEEVLTLSVYFIPQV